MALQLLFLAPAGVLVIIVVAAYISGYGMRPKDFPPGPPTLPIIGNLHLMPTSNLHLKLREWSQQYGPIMSLKLGSQDMIVISSDQVSRDLLDKRSGLYSGRMDVFIREFGEDLNILMKSNDEIWRRQRKMYHLRLNANVADKYTPYQEFETSQLLCDILERPQQYQHHVKRFTTSLASTLIYGWRTTSVDLPHVKSLYEWIDGYAVAAGRLQIMDWWPWLRPFFRNMPSWISGVSQELNRLKNIEENLWLSLLQHAKTSIASGSAKSSFCIDMINNNDAKSNDFLTDKQLAFNAGHGWAGASDTTSNSIMAFIKAVMLFPEVQKRAQEEIDRLVGQDRLPGWSDWDSLSYTRCTVKETLRWFPAAPLGGMPHCLSKEDFYRGYRLPAKAGIMLNVWTINSDPERTPRPREFDPSRFEDYITSAGESSASANPTQRDHYTFGAGRRICPGLHVVERSIFITISRLLWAFEFSRPEGPDGKPLPIDFDAMTPGFIVEPAPFKCNIRPRTSQRADFIRRNWDACQAELDQAGDYTEEFYKRVFAG